MNAGFTQMQHKIDELGVKLQKTRDAVKVIAKHVCPERVTILQENTPSTSTAERTAPTPINQTPTSSRSRGVSAIKPRFLSAPETGKYLLGSDPNYPRDIESYEIMLKSISSNRKAVTDDDKGRLLCMVLFRSEVNKDDLATKNVTGISRVAGPDGKLRTANVPVIDQGLLHVIFSQARQQFPAFSDWYLTKNCLTMKSLNDVCKKARLEKNKQAGNNREEVAAVEQD